MARTEDEMAWWYQQEAKAAKRRRFIEEAKNAGFDDNQANFLADKFYGEDL